MKEAVKTMNSSVEDQNCRDRKVLYSRFARLARNGFHISLAVAEHCLPESFAHLTTNAWASIFKCVLEHFRGVFENDRNMALPTDIILAVAKTGYVCGVANIVLEYFFCSEINCDELGHFQCVTKSFCRWCIWFNKVLSV